MLNIQKKRNKIQTTKFQNTGAKIINKNPETNLVAEQTKIHTNAKHHISSVEVYCGKPQQFVVVKLNSRNSHSS